MRPYYLYRSKSGIYYVQFFNDITKKRTYPKSTRQRTQSAAMRIACDWLVKGVPSGRGRKPLETVLSVQGMVSLISKGLLDLTDLKKITDSLASQGIGIVPALQEATQAESVKTGLVAYLENFWDYEKSPYVRDKLIHRQRIGKRHCYDSKNRVKYWKAFFTDAKRIEDVSTEDLKAFEVFLSAKKLRNMSI